MRWWWRRLHGFTSYHFSSWLSWDYSLALSLSLLRYDIIAFTSSQYVALHDWWWVCVCSPFEGTRWSKWETQCRYLRVSLSDDAWVKVLLVQSEAWVSKWCMKLWWAKRCVSVIAKDELRTTLIGNICVYIVCLDLWFVSFVLHIIHTNLL